VVCSAQSKKFCVFKDHVVVYAKQVVAAVPDKRDSECDDQVDSFFSNLIRGLLDHFNPILRAIEEVQNATKANRKK
jgi:hypothetical protein